MTIGLGAVVGAVETIRSPYAVATRLVQPLWCIPEQA
jgi:hypothetical protein